MKYRCTNCGSQLVAVVRKYIETAILLCEVCKSNSCFHYAQAYLYPEKFKKKRKNRSSMTKKRERLLQIDPVCKYCRCGLTSETATIDHVIPLSKGGSNGKSNLVLACSPCNSAKGDTIISESVQTNQRIV